MRCLPLHAAMCMVCKASGFSDSVDEVRWGTCIGNLVNGYGSGQLAYQLSFPSIIYFSRFRRSSILFSVLYLFHPPNSTIYSVFTPQAASRLRILVLSRRRVTPHISQSRIKNPGIGQR